MHRLPQPRVGNAQRDGLSHQPGRHGGVFHLLRTDPVAGALDHGVAPPDEIEQAIRLAPHPITRPHRHAAIARGRGGRLVALGGSGRILPIALRHQRPAVDQLALLAIGGKGACIVHHQNFGMGNGLAHAGRVAVNQRGIKESAAEGLGQAVHRKQPRRRKLPTQGPHQLDRQRPAAVGQAAQFSSGFNGPVQLRQLHPQRRHGGQRGHPMALDRLQNIARGQIVQRHCAGPGIPVRQQLVLPIVETQRQHRQRPIIRRQPEIAGDAFGPQPHIGMAEHHAFWPPGGARGVEDRCQIVGVGGARCQFVAQRGSLGQCRCLRQGHAGLGHVAFLKAGQPRRGAQQQQRPAVGKDMRDLRAL